MRLAVQRFIAEKSHLSLSEASELTPVLAELEHRYQNAALVIADRSAKLSDVASFAEQFPELFVVAIFPDFKPPSEIRKHPDINQAISNAPQDIGTIVESVMNRLQPITSLSRSMNAADQERLARLTDKEKHILCLTALGLSINETAAQLHRAPGTVARHRANIMRKLEMHDKVALTRFAIRLGLVSND